VDGSSAIVNELKKAAASSIYILVVFWFSTMLMPFFEEIAPKAPWAVKESLSIVVPAFLVVLLSAAVWVRPEIHVRWTDPRNGETLSNLVVRVSEQDMASGQLRMALYCKVEKSVPKRLLTYLIKHSLSVHMLSEHAPAVCIVDKCSRDIEDLPFVKSKQGRVELTATLTGTAPKANSMWVYANVNITVHELLNGEKWDISYRIQTNGSKFASMLTKLVAIRSETMCLSIEARP
jgi:hypothetical protein